MPDDFDEFMTRREEAARAYVTGNPEPVASLSAKTGQAIFFDPGGGFTEGTAQVNEVNRLGSGQFGSKGTTSFEVKDLASSRDLAFWTGFQVAEVELKGQMVSMRLRVTEVFRHNGDEWELIHRHASPAKANASSGLSAK